MNIDFALILVVGSLVTGIIWLLDHLFWVKKRPPVPEDSDETNEPIVVEYARFLFPVFIIVLVLRGFVAEPFRIPSGSMLPTLKVGDFILVNKFSYGLRLPVLNKKVIPVSDPERGDVIVFPAPPAYVQWPTVGD